RHYDALGLLRPARVDSWTGYRYYAAAQLSRLNRIIALKELGFSLHQVGAALDAEVGIAELQGMLRLRQAELAETVATATARLAHVETRLRTIENEGTMPIAEVVVKSLPTIRVAVARGLADSFDPSHIGPVIGPLYRDLHGRLEALSIEVTGPDIALYESDGDGEPGSRVVIHACVAVSAAPGSVPGVEILDLPAIERAATIVHHGSMDRVLTTIQTLARWIETSGHQADRLGRELYLESCGPQEDWVTEIQWPLR
ncbi:MerR family transcriptional regulator, partial [Nocardia sp. NPDC004722]